MESLVAIATAIAICGAAAPSTRSADRAFHDGHFLRAKRDYRDALKKNPLDTQAQLGLARIDLYTNRISQSKRYLQNVLLREPKNVLALRLQHTLTVREGRPDNFLISQDKTAVLPFVSSDPLPVVRMNIDGVAANVAIDTGAPTFVVTPAFARAHNLVVRTDGTGVFMGGQRLPIRTTTLDIIAVNHLTVRNVRAGVMMSPGPGIDAVIGTGFFSHFLTTIDYPHARLVLGDANTDGSVRGSTSVPMWLVGDHYIFARGTVNASPPLLLNVDSGGPGIGVQLTKSALVSAHIVPVASGALSVRGPAGPVQELPFAATLKIGGARRRVPGVYFPNGDQYGIFPFAVSGTVSAEFLKHFAVTLDFRRMRLTLTPAK